MLKASEWGAPGFPGESPGTPSFPPPLFSRPPPLAATPASATPAIPWGCAGFRPKVIFAAVGIMVDTASPFELSSSNEIVNDFQLTAATDAGIKTRNCPCCKKGFKVERLGEHIKKNHSDYWMAVFTVPALEAAIAAKTQVAITTEYEDHDQKFFVCLACNSVRATARDHFTKNGERHLNAHLEECKKMVAQKTGKKYTPEAVDIITKLQLQLDHYKRADAYCRAHHAEDTETADELVRAKKRIAELEDKLLTAESERNHYQEKCSRYNKTGRAAYQNVKGVSDLLGKVYQKDTKALEKAAGFLSDAMGMLMT